jgi:Leucine-rich repeat (LRR) protein
MNMIEPLRQLKSISLSEELTSDDIKKLSNHNNLEECTLSNVKDKSLDISSLHTVKKLELNGQYEEILGLDKLKNLTDLKLSSDSLRSVVIPDNLKELAIMECKFNDLSLLENIQNLNSLCLSVTEVTDLTPISKAANLKKLDIQFNEISTIEPILGLINNGLEVDFDKTKVPMEVLYLYEESKLEEINEYYANIKTKNIEL